jgi:putative transposase
MRQLDLLSRTHGGKRKGAGRKRRSSETVPHASRPVFDGGRHPLHVTLRVGRGVWNLRSQRGFNCIRGALAEERRRGTLRVVHYSVQGNHVHLIAEAHNRVVLGRRMKGLAIRFARAVNRMMGRKRGRVLAERYHLHVLRTRSEARNAVRYVLNNHVKHAAQVGKVGIAVDPFSSAVAMSATGPPLVSAPDTWMLRSGL